MKIPPVFSCGVPFAAAWAGIAWWPGGRDLEPGCLGSKKEEALTRVVERPGPDAIGPHSADGEELYAAMALAGLTERPNKNAVFSAVGSDRWLRLGLFLCMADSAAITALLARQSEEELLTEAQLEMVWQQWVETDIKTAVAWNEGDSGVWAAWARVDPKAALAAAGENARRLGPVIQAIGLKDPAWAERLMARYPQVDGAEGWAGAVARLSAIDPAAAAALAMKKGAGWEKQVAAWTLRDPPAALVWAQQIPSPALQRQAVAEVVRGWTKLDPAAGLREALKLPPGGTPVKLVSEAVIELTRKDAKAARNAVMSVPPGINRPVALAALAEGLASTAPLLALEALQSLSWHDYYAQERARWDFRGEKTGGSAVLSLERAQGAKTTIKLLTETHPQETVNLLASQHAGDSTAGEPLNHAVWYWLGSAPEAASSWLRDQPPGAARDTAIKTMVSFLGKTGPSTDYEAGLEWAASAGDAKRPELMEQVLRQWARADYNAAATAGAKYGIQVDRPGEGEESDQDGMSLLFRK